MSKGILLPAQVEGIRSRKDKSAAITLGTNELSSEIAGQIFSLQNKIVVAYISQKEELSEDEKDIVDSIEPDQKGKSPSQRLRNVLFISWESNKEGYDDFNLYYLHKMEIIINHYKSKLPER